MSAEHAPVCAENDKNIADETAPSSDENMQTIVANYMAPNLIEQADNRLIESQKYDNEAYIVDLDKRLSSDTDERIEVDVDDKIDEELEVADDVDVSEYTNQSSEDIREDNESQFEVHEGKEVKHDEFYEPSWHPHVYGKPPKKPTPHSIEYILGIGRNNALNEDLDKRSNLSQLIHVKRNFDAKRMRGNLVYSDSSNSKVQTRLDTSSDVRKFTNLNRNKVLHEQLLQRTARTNVSDSYDGQTVFNINFKSEAEPLNLSVPKPKDWSGEDDKGILRGKYYL